MHDVMSTCSTATSALRRGHENRRRRRRASPASCDAADVDVDAVGSLERRLVDLERDWDAYKSGRSSPPPRRRRRSRSVTGTPSSAVTVAAAPDSLFLLPLYRCSSPRTLISSLQQTSSADGAAEIVVAAGSPTESYKEEGLSSVCSVEEPGRKNSAAAPAFSSCSCCPCRCTVCGVGYSASAGAPSASSSCSAAGGGTAGERARKNDGGREVAGTCRAAWISAVVGLVIMGFVFVVAMAVLELGVGDGCAEYLVPT
ncbi:unnamed protein product [Urochloa humidicola]